MTQTCDTQHHAVAVPVDFNGLANRVDSNDGSGQRKDFIGTVHWFPGNAKSQWRRLLTLGDQLAELTLRMASRTQPDLKLPAYPIYGMKHLALGVRKASLSLIENWDAILSFSTLRRRMPRHGRSLERCLGAMRRDGCGTVFG